MTIKTKRWLVLGLGVAIGISVWIYADIFYNQFWSNFESKVRAGQVKIAVKELVNYDWDLVCVVHSYRASGLIARNDLVRGDISEFKSALQTIGADNLWFFFFVRDGKVVALEQSGASRFVEAKFSDNCMKASQAKFDVSSFNPKIVYITDK